MNKGILILLLAALLAACSIESGISQSEAEEIALEQAAADGFGSPELWTRFGEETAPVYQYSKTLNKDVGAWAVSIEAEGNPAIKNTPAAIYYISKEKGEVVDQIRGIDPS
ncbi:hypothetical protein [Planococcus lenghuensis]|uniref:Lipoprotein n=1 Tax=Planococcus lenghuensis TaxID=2213202 RepID=A0A1Q2KWN5_9BACL|nr:hypothetical protein [Planococcus lenghuensis]AQQ52599.1 hypothetical protein B0X71_05475 [Planococcus lenghuensis]